MHILFLGGTSFVGRHLAEAMIAAGHNVTFFNRGMTDGSLFASHVHLQVDRCGDVGALGTVDVDIVIDTSGYTPDSVRASALAVAGHASRYIFMSSIDVGATKFFAKKRSWTSRAPTASFPCAQG